ncbi:MAG TPA: ABC transporter ATP-binding protein/permease [Desulfobacterales bacterium]
MDPSEQPVVKRSLFYWIRTTGLKLQFLLILIILVTVFARVVPLEMQKRIINQTIMLRKVDLLLIYCGIYLGAVILQGGLKYLINYIQTLLAQRALAGMRRDLFRYTLTLPLNFFRKTQPGMVVASLITELTTSGNFVGMAIAVPVTNILTLLAFAGYLLWLNPLLAVLSLSIYPIVLLLVPYLQRRANQLNKKRVDTTRKISSHVAEAVTGIHEIQGNGAFKIESDKFERLVKKLEKIRVVWTLYSQGIKVLNNFFTNLSPFLVFLVGGYLAMQGRLELGALVAFLSAQEKLYNPWKEMIEFYQVYQDASVRYYRTMRAFDVAPEYTLEPKGRKPYALEGDLDVNDLSFEVEGGVRLLDGISFSMRTGEHLALVGYSGSGKSTLAQCIGQLYRYTGGQIRMSHREVSDLSKKDIVQNVGFVSQSPFIFTGTIEENLLYGCRAMQNGAGTQLPQRDDIISVLQQTGIFADVLRFGLNAVLSQAQDPELVSRVLRARQNFQRDFGRELAPYVEFFEENRYQYYSSIAENLIFGTPETTRYQPAHLIRNDEFLHFLKEVQLTDPLLGLGHRLAGQIVDILGDLPPDSVFFQQSPITPEELEIYKPLVENIRKSALESIPEPDRRALLTLALRFVPGIHKIAALSESLERRILDARLRFREKIRREHPEAVTFFQKESYIDSQTLLNNMLFGKIKQVNPQAQEKINQSIVHLLIEEDFLETIIEIGMQYDVGSKGDNLSGGQRQKLAIARALLKNPRYLIMDEATSALDNRSQARIQNLLETRWKGKSTVIAVVHRLDIVRNFDKVAVMKAGKIGEIGTYKDLINRKGMLYELEYGKP